MAKIHTIYPYARLVKCPALWSYYKELEDSALIIMESEHKHPGELFFIFSGLKSSQIVDINMSPQAIGRNLIEIITHEGKHQYSFEIWDKKE